jgi:hypothetical protein
VEIKKIYLSFSLSLRSFSRHALELEGAHESDLPLQQGKKIRVIGYRICQENYFSIDAAERRLPSLIIFTLETILNCQFDSIILTQACRLVEAKWLHYTCRLCLVFININ